MDTTKALSEELRWVATFPPTWHSKRDRGVSQWCRFIGILCDGADSEGDSQEVQDMPSDLRRHNTTLPPGEDLTAPRKTTPPNTQENRREEEQGIVGNRGWFGVTVVFTCRQWPRYELCQTSAVPTANMVTWDLVVLLRPTPGPGLTNKPGVQDRDRRWSMLGHWSWCWVLND